MRIENIDFGFIETIENGTVEKTVCKYGKGEDDIGTCTIYFYDLPPKELNIEFSSFNSQYGMPVSEDGSKLFVGNWDKGLYAYDIMSGKRIWRFRPGKIRQIFVYPQYLIVARAYASIVKIDINTGELLAEIKSGTLEDVFDLGYPYIFAYTPFNSYSVIDVGKMLVIKKYGAKTANPLKCGAFVITDATIQDNQLIISGYEDHPKVIVEKKNPVIKKGPKFGEFGYAFTRIIDPDFLV